MNRTSWGHNSTGFEHLIPEDDREDVMEIVGDEDLNVESKISMLKNMVDVRVLMTIMTYLQSLETTSSTPEDFLNLVKDEKRKKLLRIALKNNDMESLEMLLANQTRQVQKAFEKWKSQTDQNNQQSIAKAPSASRNSSMRLDSRRMSNVSFLQQQSFQARNSDSDDADTISQVSNTCSDTASVEDLERQTEINIHPDFMNKLPNCTNILVLGETGVGKSTFINGLANYLKYGTIEDALDGGVEILIKTFFSITDDDFEGKTIECDPTVEVEQGGDPDENEQTECGKSCTQAPKSYLFTWGAKGSKKAIRIIDTPGVGDVRGANQEIINFGKIMSFISQFKEIHAICILMKSNNARLTLTFRYCVNELLTHLHISSRENIIWCFTNARQSHFKPGDTLPTLNAHLDKLRKERKIELKTDRDTMYCFDNESFRYLCALKEGAYFNPANVHDFNTSWKKTVEETFRMFKRISKLRPHNSEDFVSLNQIRAVVMGLAKPLVEISKNQLTNATLIEQKILEIEDCKRLEIDLTPKLSVDQVNLTPKNMDYPITVCTAKSCVSHEHLNPDDPNSPIQTIYKTECHTKCYLNGVEASVCPNTTLQTCSALRDNIEKCVVCGCSWQTHMHVRYRMEKTMEKVTDPQIQKLVNENADKLQTAEAFLKKIRRKKEEYEQEVKTITSHSAEFAAYISKNSVLPYNDSFKEYLDHQIKEEKDMGGNSTVLPSLIMLRAQHEEMSKLVKNRTSSKTKSLEQIYRMVEELKQLKNCGWLIEEVQKLEMAGVRKQQSTVGTSVDLNQGWFGRLASKIPGSSRASNFFSGKRK